MEFVLTLRRYKQIMEFLRPFRASPKARIQMLLGGNGIKDNLQMSFGSPRLLCSPGTAAIFPRRRAHRKRSYFFGMMILLDAWWIPRDHFGEEGEENGEGSMTLRGTAAKRNYLKDNCAYYPCREDNHCVQHCDDLKHCSPH